MRKPLCLLSLLVLTEIINAQPSANIGVCATPVVTPAGVVLSVSLIGEIDSLPDGTTVSLMHGDTVISQEIVSQLGRVKVVPPPPFIPIPPPIIQTSFPLLGIAGLGDTVAMTRPDGTTSSLAIGSLIMGTELSGETLTIFGTWTSMPTIFIGGSAIRGTNAVGVGQSSAVSVGTGRYHGWQTVTLCQNGTCDTVLVRLPGSDSVVAVH